MNNTLLRLLTVLVIFAMGILLVLNMKEWIPGVSGYATYLKKDNIRSVTIIHEGDEYPMNLNQQERFIALINRSVPVDKIREEGKKVPPYSQEIRIDRIEGDDVTLTPIVYVDNSLIYSVPQWNPHGYMMDLTDGALQSLILEVISRKSQT